MVELKLDFPHGRTSHLCELQLNTNDMLHAKEVSGHRDYELIRELQAAVAAGDLHSCEQAFEWAQKHLGSSRQELVMRSRDGATLLHRACAKGHVDIALCFLAQRCDPNAQDDDDNTSLHLAVREGHERVVWALLNKASADLTIKNKREQTALLVGYLSHRAKPQESTARALSTLAHAGGLAYVKTTRQRVEEEIKKSRKPSSHLVDFSSEGRLDKMAKALQQFADPDSTRGGVSALGAAVQAGQLGAIELLLKYGPNPATHKAWTMF